MFIFIIYYVQNIEVFKDDIRIHILNKPNDPKSHCCQLLTEMWIQTINTQIPSNQETDIWQEKLFLTTNIPLRKLELDQG